MNLKKDDKEGMVKKVYVLRNLGEYIKRPSWVDSFDFFLSPISIINNRRAFREDVQTFHSEKSTVLSVP